MTNLAEKEKFSVFNSYHTGNTKPGVRRSVATHILLITAGVGSLTREQSLEEKDEIPYLLGKNRLEKLAIGLLRGGKLF